MQQIPNNPASWARKSQIPGNLVCGFLAQSEGLLHDEVKIYAVSQVNV